MIIIIFAIIRNYEQWQYNRKQLLVINLVFINVERKILLLLLKV